MPVGTSFSSSVPLPLVSVTVAVLSAFEPSFHVPFTILNVTVTVSVLSVMVRTPGVLITL